MKAKDIAIRNLLWPNLVIGIKPCKAMVTEMAVSILILYESGVRLVNVGRA